MPLSPQIALEVEPIFASKSSCLSPQQHYFEDEEDSDFGFLARDSKIREERIRQRRLHQQQFQQQLQRRRLSASCHCHTEQLPTSRRRSSMSSTPSSTRRINSTFFQRQVKIAGARRRRSMESTSHISRKSSFGFGFNDEDDGSTHMRRLAIQYCAPEDDVSLLSFPSSHLTHNSSEGSLSGIPAPETSKPSVLESKLLKLDQNSFSNQSSQELYDPIVHLNALLTLEAGGEESIPPTEIPLQSPPSPEILPPVVALVESSVVSPKQLPQHKNPIGLPCSPEDPRKNAKVACSSCGQDCARNKTSVLQLCVRCRSTSSIAITNSSHSNRQTISKRGFLTLPDWMRKSR